MSESTAQQAEQHVSFEHEGATWSIPLDLVEVQREWNAVAGVIETLVDGDDVEVLQRARERRLELTDRLYEHPWLREQFKLGRRPQADRALKAAARSRE